MKIISLNCRVWTRDRDKSSVHYWKKRMVKINEFIKKENPDILCLQELSFPANLYVPKNYKRVGLSIYHHIYVRKGIKARPLWFSIHHNGAKINDVRIINIHGTWRKCMRKVWQKLRNKVTEKTIIIGDFNQTKDVVEIQLKKPINYDYEVSFHNYAHDYEYMPDHCVVFGLNADIEIVNDGFQMSDHLPLIVNY